MDVAALFEFLIFLFLPGIGITQLLDLHTSSFTEDLALFFAFGGSVDVLLLIGGTSGYTVAGVVLRGVFPGTVNLMLGVSGAVFALGLILRRRITFHYRPSRTDLAALSLVAVQFLMVAVHFAEYPIFPEFTSVDFSQHVVIATDLQAGNLASIPGGILYYGVHVLMAALLSLTSDPSLVATQTVMGVLVVLSPLLIYSGAKAFSNSTTALISTFVYVLGGFVWFGSVFNAGLYSNFYGLLSALFITVAASLVLKEPRRLSPWVIFLVSVVNAYFSHYSTLTIIPALIALPILGFFFTRKVEKALLGLAIVPLVPMIAVGLTRPSLVSTLLSFVSASGGANITGDTLLSPLFSWSPFLRYIVIEITSDSASVVILAMGALGAYFVLRQRRPMAWLPLVWLVSVAVAAPQSETAWRFSYVALTPLLILASMGFAFVLPPAPRVAVVSRKGRRPAVLRRNRLVLTSAFLILLVAGSWGTSLVADAAVNGQADGRAQYDVYNSMVWFANNTPSDSRLVSVTDSRYDYLGLLTGRSSAYSPLITPADLLSQVKGQRDIYVVVTRLATLSVNASQGSDLLGSYSTNPAFTLRYNNGDVTIYSVNSP